MHVDHQYIEALRRGDARGIDAIYKQFSTQARRWVEQERFGRRRQRRVSGGYSGRL